MITRKSRIETRDAYIRCCILLDSATLLAAPAVNCCPCSQLLPPAAPTVLLACYRLWLVVPPWAAIVAPSWAAIVVPLPLTWAAAGCWSHPCHSCGLLQAAPCCDCVEMVLDLAISLISSLPSPLLHGLATIFLSPIFSSIGLQIHPRLEMGRTGATPVRGHAASTWW
ncbi:hypothetical protein Acr_25g0002060 [Actinidia rufa]|uniref:Uncharacterized protein n=1 Tax=Actinidia rufa TaxID=165716 RepID=A0A7J0GY90_9ERIC|nr:hypothetical protein Acr_25g0002060 [Actinidia rufa]